MWPTTEPKSLSNSPIELKVESAIQLDSEAERPSPSVDSIILNEIAHPPLERPHHAAIEWIPRLLASEMFKERKRLGDRRNHLSDEELGELLDVLMNCGGIMQTAALGRALKREDNPRGLLAIVQRIVNFDGILVLECDDADTVRLNRDWLFKQFGLE